MSSLIKETTLRLPNDDLERHTTWLEIFFDLIFAVIVIQVSDRLLINLTWFGVLKCIALFLPTMWTWASYTVFAARFDNNDAIHWVMTFIIMFAGIIMATQIPTAFEQGANGFAIGFFLGQVVILLLYSRTIFDDLTPKPMIWLYMIGFGLGGILWFTSLFVAPPTKFILWSFAMCFYLFTPWIGRKKILSKAPLDTIYIPERFGAFTLIILGQIIASVVFGLKSASWNPFSLLTSILAFIMALLIWGQYYRYTQIAEYKCTLGSGQPYIYIHIPLIISLILIGACTEKFITEPLIIKKTINQIFCASIILYLLSFHLLQYLTRKKSKFLAIFSVGELATLVFFYPFYPIICLSGIFVIIMLLFSLQYRLDS